MNDKTETIYPVGWVNPAAAQIKALEESITLRRQREAILAKDGGWLADVDRQITELRDQLKQGEQK